MDRDSSKDSIKMEKYVYCGPQHISKLRPTSIWDAPVRTWELHLYLPFFPWTWLNEFGGGGLPTEAIA